MTVNFLLLGVLCVLNIFYCDAASCTKNKIFLNDTCVCAGGYKALKYFSYDFENSSDLSIFTSDMFSKSNVINIISSVSSCKSGKCVQYVPAIVDWSSRASIIKTNVFDDPNSFSFIFWYKIGSSNNLPFLEIHGPLFGPPTWAGNDYFSVYTASTQFKVLSSRSTGLDTSYICCFNADTWTQFGVVFLNGKVKVYSNGVKRVEANLLWGVGPSEINFFGMGGYYDSFLFSSEAFTDSQLNDTFNAVDANSCVTCPSGFFCPVGSATSVSGISCSVGSYCPAGSITDTPCQAGYYCKNTTSILPCPYGSYCAGGNTASEPCQAGSYCATPATQVLCPANSYCPVNSTAPTACLAGKISAINSSTLNQCVCPSVQQSVVNNRCSCPSGQFSSGGNCLACPVGMMCAVSLDPILCSAGTYCPDGSTTEQACQAGSYCATPATQVLCPANSYCPVNSTAPTPCSDSKVSPAASISLDACQKNEISFVITIDNVDPSVNQAQFQTNLPENIKINAYQDVIFSTQTLCPTGYFCPADTINPVPCPAGSYNNEQNKSAATDCKICPVGQYCPINSTIPTVCSATSYRDTTGASSQSDCITCPQHTVSTEGSSSLLNCRCEQGFVCSYTKIITAVITLNTSVSSFNDQSNPVRATFITAVSTAAGVSASHVIIQHVNATPRSRRLLSKKSELNDQSINVHTTIRGATPPKTASSWP